MTHITIMCVTLFLHRSQAHKSVTFHPAVSHFMRFWLWLTTGMVTKEWVAVHRQHHQASDTKDDPHSPKQYGIWRVLFGGWWLYAKAKNNNALIAKLGVGTPNDWVEQKIYSKYTYFGIIILLLINLCLFGAWGLAIWLVQMAWIPFWAAGVINGLAHWWGYRVANTPDTSRNLWPWAVWIGGEELHNGHHSDGANAKFSKRPWEFDIGWFYITLLRSLNLAKLREK